MLLATSNEDNKSDVVAKVIKKREEFKFISEIKEKKSIKQTGRFWVHG